MSDQNPRGRKRIAGRRPTRPATPNPATELLEPTEPTHATEPTEPAAATHATETTAATAASMPAKDETGTTESGEPTDADESVDADESEAADESMEPAESADRGGLRARVLVAALAVLLVATLTVGGILGQKAWSNHEEEQGRDAAAGAASKAAALVLSYDYRQLDQDFAAARKTLTPDFAAKFDATTKVVGEQAAKTRATVKAEVREVSVSNSSADVVNVLLFVNQTTTSTVTQGKPRVDLNRARFTMVRSGDGWLVQEVAGL